ncbi:MAG: TetR family transcriptional regulator [Gammaproteobacteria bacterium CG22_combo_CG10-13_8_21_14_all_40_8]|nr:MAG: TetR family transcriptional regulator [Gammaproteobacteria bacterium CG22_combo_CG10-13_8_21_14_all_40_8]
MKRAISNEAKADKKQKILFAALDEFFENGFAATKMSNIAQNAQVSKGTLYLYFPSKESLFEGLVEIIALPKIQQIEQLFSTKVTVEEALKGLFSVLPLIIRQSQLPKLIKIMISDAFVFPNVVSFYRKNIINRGITALTQLIQQGIKSGEVKTVDAESCARLIIAPALLSIIWTVVFESQSQPTLDIPALFKQHQEILLSALLTQRSNHDL